MPLAQELAGRIHRIHHEDPASTVLDWTGVALGDVIADFGVTAFGVLFLQ